MGTIRNYSDSEEFLQGIESGVSQVGDSSICVTMPACESDNPKYGFMNELLDDNICDDIIHFHNGTSLDYTLQIRPDDWNYEVTNGDTTLGFEEWKLHKIESDRG